MKTRRSVLRLSAPVLVLGLALSASAQVTSPQGSYGILLNQWIDAKNATSALLALLNFDGAGNISGSYTLVTKNYAVLTGAMTGTYSGNPDGSNTVNLTFDIGAILTASSGHRRRYRTSIFSDRRKRCVTGADRHRNGPHPVGAGNHACAAIC